MPRFAACFVKHIKRGSFTLADVLWFSKDHYEMKRMPGQLMQERLEQRENTSWRNKKLGLKYGSFNLHEYLSNLGEHQRPTQSPAISLYSKTARKLSRQHNSLLCILPDDTYAIDTTDTNPSSYCST
jgi:hypothetical protein